MKLTPELLAQASSHLNPCKERQLDLRGCKIPAIENLGVTKDQHDAIDFTDNQILSLSNFPLLKRLCSLYLANNVISSISPSLHLSTPNLTTLVLTNNAIQNLGDLEPLAQCSKLVYLSLMGNPVAEKKYYREWLIWRNKNLRVLDYQRVRDKEREAAKKLFLTPQGTPTSLAESLQAAVSAHGKPIPTAEEPRAGPAAGSKFQAGRLMSKEEQERVKKAIAEAKSVEEIRRLERSLREGYLPEMESVGA
ncbi:leucine-rich repeat-domain-containing protein [Schizophyllum commune]|uniref:U2 small nuclear ribonucleoprotein A' n=1 Tax=Schizophyllum commune (strain H4-8 / FGSC 9210) TaxID=578458 RepID=D8PRQ2_SCHCM|nr:L domain-like protein [Schizophyllum commune H4-8]KAI5825248.1 L domain-like protein [Schizophyllum commune Tattone D]KAI5897967.1 L domain-like protein [Schizophyllum commune H4-8]